MHRITTTRTGFAIPEAVMLIITLAAAAALLAVLAQRTRQSAGLSQSLANLRQISAWGGSYAADNQDRVMGFSWLSSQSGGNPNISQFPDLRGYQLDIDASICQAIDIMRRRSPRTDMPRIGSWYPFAGYWHVPLVDYLDGALPDIAFVSPGDAVQMRWARDPQAFWTNQLQPQPNASDRWNDRWPNFSSYEMMPAFTNADGRSGERSPGFGQGSSHYVYSTIGFGLITFRRHDEIAFPDAKVLLAERFDRFHGKADTYHLYSEARVPVLMSDGSTRVRTTAQSNPGWRPESRRASFSLTFAYSPQNWEPLPHSGAGQNVTGHYRWTRGGLQGRDFDGPEINTSNW